MNKIFKILENSDFRCFSLKKPPNPQSEAPTHVFSFFYLAVMLSHSLIGVGIFSLHGDISKYIAGPAIVYSYLIIAVLMLLSGLNLAEFCSHSNATGSTYLQTYMIVGELWAFVVGWLTILCYCLETAVAAKILSGYVDFFNEFKMRTELGVSMPLDGVLGVYSPDLLGAVIIVVFAVFLVLGCHETVNLKSVSSVLIVVVCIIFIIAGSYCIDGLKNWGLELDFVLEDVGVDGDAGEGGFSPYDYHGIIKGAAFCAYGFTGIKVLSQTIAKTKRPQLTTNLAFFVAMLSAGTLYAGTSAVLNLMTPYYKQEDVAVLTQPFTAHADVFRLIQPKTIINCVVIFAVFCKLIGMSAKSGMEIETMAADGLLFEVLAKKCGHPQTPNYAILLAGILTTLLCVFFKISHLIQLISLVTLLLYTLIAIFVIKLRYKYEYPSVLNTDAVHEQGCLRGFMIEKLNGAAKDGKTVTVISSHIVCISILLYFIWCVLFSLIMFYHSKAMLQDDEVGIFPILLATVFVFIGFVLVQQMQPQKMNKTYFMLPTPPLWPCLSIIFNLILLAYFGEETWVMFGIWLSIGLAIYLWYGRQHSKQLNRELSLQNVYELGVLSISGVSDSEPNATASHQGEEPVKKTWFSMFY